MKIAFLFNKPDFQTLASIQKTGFNGIICGYQNLDQSIVDDCLKLNLCIWMEIGCFVGEELWTKFPESRPIVNGKLISKFGPPGNLWYAGVIPTPEVISDRIDLIKKQVNLSGISALYLDFCRFPGRWEDGEGNFIFADNMLNDMAQRQVIITDFIKQIKKTTDKANVELGLFLTPYDNHYYGQDVYTISEICSFVSPMLYHKICHQPVSWIGDRIDYFYHLTKKQVVPVIQSLPEPGPISAVDFHATLKQINSVNCQGFIVLSWDHLTDEMKQMI